MNSNLLKEAIADAKAVRATSLANAKAALEEAFSKRFESVFADKLREDSTIDEPLGEPKDECPMEESTNKDNVGSTKPSKSDGTKDWGKNGDPAAKPTTKNITPNTVPAGKDGGDGTKPWSKDNKGNAMDGTPAGVKENTEEACTEEESVEEAVTNEDLDEIIRELEAEANDAPADPAAGGMTPDAPAPDMDAVGGETPEEHEQEIKSGDTVTITKTTAPAVPAPEAPAPEAPGGEVPPSPEGEQPPMEEEDVDLNELLASLNEEAKDDDDDEKEEDEKKEKKDEVDEALTTQLNEVTSQRDEAFRTVQYLRNQLNEINLLNAKLLYTNKLFKEFGMNRDQKTKVVEAFDLTKNVREVKMTFANWCESLNFGGNAKKRVVQQAPPSSVTTITEGLASKVVASTKPKTVITESVNEMADRFKKLAGIPLKK